MSSENSFVYDLNSKTDGCSQLNNIVLNFGLFFDGTRNNKWNTSAQKIAKGKERANTPQEKADAKAAYDKYGNKDDDSFENDYTNVARLFQHANRDYKIYVEGPGTTTREDQENNRIIYGYDKDGGFAFGHGTTGIRAKVKLACYELAQKIQSGLRKINTQDYRVETIVDVYGFSRGAAAARNFIYEITRNDGIYALNSNPDQQRYEPSKYTNYESIPPKGFLGFYLKQLELDLNTTDVNFKIRFAGLFDTVSSYEPEGSFGLVGSGLSHDFENDATELHLSAVSKADRALHITAIDEHRKNFALTNIASAKSEKHIEIALPGVHSDIGGSYEDGMTESVEVMDADSCALANQMVDLRTLGVFSKDKAVRKKLEEEKARLIEQGWFLARECTSNIKTDMFYELKFSRQRLSNKYSFIPLHLMAKYIVEKWQGKMFYKRQNKQFVIDYDKLNDKYPVTSKASKCSPFSVKNGVITFELGQVNCVIHKIETPQPQKYYRPPFLWDMKGNVSGAKDTWIECVNALLKYVFQYPGYLGEEVSLDALKFATDHIISAPLPDSTFSFPRIVNMNELLSKYAYQHIPNINAEKEALDMFAKDIGKINNELMKQIYIKRLRNRYLHWSATLHATSVMGLVAPYKPRIVDKQRKRLVIPG